MSAAPKTFTVIWKQDQTQFTAYKHGDGFMFHRPDDTKAPWRHLPEKDFWKCFERVALSLF